MPVAKGEPDEGYPCEWTVCEWLEGENPSLGRLAGPLRAAGDLARFISALQEIDPGSGPSPGEHDFFRGLPPAARDARTRECIEQLAGLIDTRAVLAAWELDLSAPGWDRPPVWVHGDLAPGNLLARDGELTSVIDWGGLGVGDPAIELLPAWNLFAGESREVFREASGVDDATWSRGRGLALSHGLIALPCYLDSNPAIVRWAREILDAVLEDHQRSS